MAHFPLLCHSEVAVVKSWQRTLCFDVHHSKRHLPWGRGIIWFKSIFSIFHQNLKYSKQNIPNLTFPRSRVVLSWVSILHQSIESLILFPPRIKWYATTTELDGTKYLKDIYAYLFIQGCLLLLPMIKLWD